MDERVFTRLLLRAQTKKASSLPLEDARGGHWRGPAGSFGLLSHVRELGAQLIAVERIR